MEASTERMIKLKALNKLLAKIQVEYTIEFFIYAIWAEIQSYVPKILDHTRE